MIFCAFPNVPNAYVDLTLSLTFFTSVNFPWPFTSVNFCNLTSHYRWLSQQASHELPYHWETPRGDTLEIEGSICKVYNTSINRVHRRLSDIRAAH